MVIYLMILRKIIQILRSYICVKLWIRYFDYFDQLKLYFAKEKRSFH